MEEQELVNEGHTRPINETYKHDIAISECDRGYIVIVGCKKFVFESLDDMIGILERYLRNRDEVETMYRQGKLF